MEALLVINSILAGISLYFIKDFHTEFKAVVKKVERLDEKVRIMSNQTDPQSSREADQDNL